MPVSVSVLYPNDPESSFNLEYYLTAHMPLVQERFGKHGLKSWKVNKLASTASGDTTPYSVKCTLEFDSEAQIHKAFQSEGADVLADIKNFSNKQPVMMIGEIVGSWP